MHRRLSAVVRAVAVLVVLVLALPLFAGKLEPTGRSIEGEVLIKVRPGAGQAEMASIHNLADADDGERLASVASGVLWRLHSRSKNAEALATALQKNPNIVYAEPNYIVRLAATPNDTAFGNLWGLRNTGQSIGGQLGLSGSDINATAAWNITTGSASVVVGVVDTGVDYNHPDLAANMWSNPGAKGHPDCAAGTHGFNAITDTCNPMDDHDHGTHVAGTIGAVGNNATGVVGVNWTTSIMALKFIGWSGYGTTADAIQAIEFAVQAKIDGVNVRVLNNSWGNTTFSKALLDEINRANEHDILFVAAAGNDGVSNDVYPHYPASYATPNIISVAATDNRDNTAWFTNYGPTTVHLGAPGVSTYSTVRGSAYSYFSGTSMASPHVAGVAALVLAHSPGLTTAEVKEAILDNTDPIPSLSGKTITGGRLNAARALGVPPGPTFTLSVAPASQSVLPSGATSYTVTITPANGFAGAVSLSVTGLPAGATATFNPVSATTSSTLTISTTASTPLTSYPLTITGTSGEITRTATATLSVVSTLPAAVCPSFASPYQNAVSSPTSVATGDFNRDGRIDVAFSSVSGNKVGIRLGNGNGTFQAASYFSTGSAPLSVAVGDFNGDGKLDLASANSGSGNVSVLLGNGDGSFQNAVPYAAGTSPFAVATGDFDRDGVLDLAVANNGSSNVSVLSGQGDGTFGAAVHYGAASGPFALAVADLDRDGSLDLAVADYNDGKVSILLGNSDGTFAATVNYDAATGPSSVAAADFNGDGIADLAVSNYGSNNVSILVGAGDGTFATAVNHAAGSGPYSVAVGDFNGDGTADLSVANGTSASVSVLLGLGTGGFAAAVHYAALYEPNQVAVGDFNGDGKDDLAVANVASNAISIHLNNGVCSASCGAITAPLYHAVGGTPYGVAAGDLDRDGDLDLAASSRGSNNVSIALGNGDGTFYAGITAAAGTNPDSAAIGDFDRDGDLDVVAANSGSGNVSVLLNNGDATLQSAVDYAAGTTPRAIAVGDLDRDGTLDLAVANGGSNNVSVLTGNGDGTFGAALNRTVGTTPLGVAIGDFNRDGKPDLAVANSGSGNVSILTGNGDATFTETLVTVGTTPRALVVGDFNRDGKPDLAVANSGSNNVSLLLGNGDGAFQTAIDSAVGTSPFGVAVGDFNDDGRVDLAVSNNASANVSLLYGNGGGFSGAVHSAAGSGPATLVAADLDRDGKPDLAAAGSGSSSIVLLRNTCPSPDLTVTKTHSGNFSQGATGKTYTIVVKNSGGAATTAPVTVKDTAPVGLTVTAMSGSGWTCTLSSTTCSRSNALAAGASYPAITVTVNVASSAPSSVTNTVTVAGGGELNSINNTASDPTTITASTDLLITKTHAGSFAQGDTGRTYRIVVRNGGSLATSGTVTMTDTLPAGLTATAISGTGWSCVLGSLTCTRSDVLAGASSYPPITVTVNVAANAAGLLTNTATVSGGGDSSAGNNTASDPTTIWSSSTCGTFGAITRYDTGSNPNEIEVADFNGDGKADVASVNYYSGNVSILLGNGNGTLQSAVHYAANNSPEALAKGDFNHDGKVDLITSSSYQNNVSILLGNGNGTFAAPLTFPASGDMGDVATGDFNNDSNLDVVVTDYYTQKVMVLLGNGDGTLQAGVSYATSSGASRVAVADINGNGTADLAVTGYSGVSILSGNGDGTFAPYVLLTGHTDAYVVTAGDLNGDGKIDLAIASYYYNLWVRLGNGDGTFQSPLSFTAAYGNSTIVIEDVDADGKTDVLVSTYDGVKTMLGNGDGTLTAGVFYSSYNTRGLAIADFNSDGQADLAFASTYQNKVSIVLGGCPDLTIAKAHSGDFYTGGSGSYTITVTNSGGATSGTVTVVDSLPDGLTATSMWGPYYWNCTLATLTCTTTEPIVAGTTHTITVWVTVDGDAAESVTNTATVSGGGDINPANNTASDPTTIIRVPDMTVTKTHEGMFAQGQIGRTYTIIAKNSGGVPTSGTVTVTDYLPWSLTATDMSGPGWSCNVSTRSCTRSDVLAPNTPYPPITLTVNVATNATWAVTNQAWVSGGGEMNSSNNWANDYTEILVTPGNVTATAVSNTQIDVQWSSVNNAEQYEVLRSSNNGPFVVIATVASSWSPSYSDLAVQGNTAYLYRVRSKKGTTVGMASPADLATTILFTDDPLLPGTTSMKTVHITQLRTAVNAVRAAAGLAPASFTDPSLTVGSWMKAIHITQLRTALDQARALLPVAPLVYTDPSLNGGMTIKAAHIRELRLGVK